MFECLYRIHVCVLAQTLSVAAAALVDAAVIPSVQSAHTAAGYGLAHGSAELVHGGSTTKTIPAALRLVEEMTMPLTATEAVAPGAHALGFPETHKPETSGGANVANSEGELNGAELGKVDTEELRSMQDTIFAALRAREEHSAGDARAVEHTH